MTAVCLGAGCRHYCGRPSNREGQAGGGRGGEWVGGYGQNRMTLRQSDRLSHRADAVLVATWQERAEGGGAMWVEAGAACVK